MSHTTPESARATSLCCCAMCLQDVRPARISGAAKCGNPRACVTSAVSMGGVASGTMRRTSLRTYGRDVCNHTRTYAMATSSTTTATTAPLIAVWKILAQRQQQCSPSCTARPSTRQLLKCVWRVCIIHWWALSMRFCQRCAADAQISNKILVLFCHCFCCCVPKRLAILARRGITNDSYCDIGGVSLYRFRLKI